MHSLGGGSKAEAHPDIEQAVQALLGTLGMARERPLGRPPGTDTELRRTRAVRADGKLRTVEQLAADASTSTATAKRARRK
jgi:hypothetical protein